MFQLYSCLLVVLFVIHSFSLLAKPHTHIFFFCEMTIAWTESAAINVNQENIETIKLIRN